MALSKCLDWTVTEEERLQCSSVYTLISSYLPNSQEPKNVWGSCSQQAESQTPNSHVNESNIIVYVDNAKRYKSIMSYAVK